MCRRAPQCTAVPPQENSRCITTNQNCITRGKPCCITPHQNCITRHHRTSQRITRHHSASHDITVHYMTSQCITIHYSALYTSTRRRPHGEATQPRDSPFFMIPFPVQKYRGRESAISHFHTKVPRKRPRINYVPIWRTNTTELASG